MIMTSVTAATMQFTFTRAVGTIPDGPCHRPQTRGTATASDAASKNASAYTPPDRLSALDGAGLSQSTARRVYAAIRAGMVISDVDCREGIPRATRASGMSPEEMRLVEEKARLVAETHSMTPSTRQEFLANALGHIGSKYHSFDKTRDFGGWCFVVLLNYGVDTIRYHARSRRNLIEAVQHARCSTTEPLDSPGSGLAATDAIYRLIEIFDRHVSGRDRIIMAIDQKMLGCMDGQRVADWIHAAGLPAAFPWRDIETVEPQAERRLALAKALAGNVPWLRQRIRRTIERLQQLLGGRET